MKVIFAFLLLAGVLAQPQISEIFDSVVHVYVDESGVESWGHGYYSVNQPAGLALEAYEFDVQKHQHQNIFVLQRFDLGYQYEMFSPEVNSTKCSATALPPNMPPVWAWLADAVNTRNYTWGKEVYNVWTYSVAGVSVELVVAEKYPTQPVYLFRNSSSQQFAIEFRMWSTEAPPASRFQVPPQCSSAQKSFHHGVHAPDSPDAWVKYMQCDSSWGSNQLGTCSLDICQAGCAMSCVAMALSTKGHSIDPGSLNAWLDQHGGYADGCDIVWSAVNAFGVMTFVDMENADYAEICAGVAAGHAIIINVRGGTHWVLVTGCSGGNYLVNDPYFPVNSYSPSDVLTEAVYH